MSEWKDLLTFLYGDVCSNRGFWYSHPLREVAGLTEAQLFWTPDPNSLCALWHMGHIAQRERLHVGLFLQGNPEPVTPAQFDLFGSEWASVDQVRQSVPSVQTVFDWVQEVRTASLDYITSLKEEDLLTVPFNSDGGLSIAHWLVITASHTALHIGRIQLLRAMIEGKPERAC